MLNIHDYLKSARFEMNIADLFFVSRETLPIGLKKVQHPLFSPTIDYFSSDGNLYHRHYKSPSERKKTTSIAILWHITFLLYCQYHWIYITWRQNKRKNKWKKKPSMISIPNTINTIMQENCCHPSWYRSWQAAHGYKIPIPKGTKKKEGYSSRTSLLWIYYNNILI